MVKRTLFFIVILGSIAVAYALIGTLTGCDDSNPTYVICTCPVVPVDSLPPDPPDPDDDDDDDNECPKHGRKNQRHPHHPDR